MTLGTTEPLFFIPLSRLFKAERGPRPTHKYIRRERRGTRYVYFYRDEATGREIDHDQYVMEYGHLPQHEQTELLTRMGDYLDGIDNVEEINDAGFNKIDKDSWHHVRGNGPRMKRMLYKYQEQLASRFHSDTHAINWSEGLATATGPVITPEKHPDGYAIPLGGTRLDRDKFGQYLKVNQDFKARFRGMRYNGDTKVWSVPIDFDFDGYRARMAGLGITVGEVPEPSEEDRAKIEAARVARVTPTPTAPAGPRTFHDIDALENDIKRNRERDVVVIRPLPDGRFSIVAPFSADLNAAYRNAEEFGGILKWDAENKRRVVGKNEIGDLAEAVALIQKTHPTWTVVTPGLDDAIARIEHERRLYRVAHPEMTRHYREGIAPMPHQVEGVKKLHEFDGKVLIGDDMGLGKTMQVLTYAAMANRRMLVVCPKNVRRQWIQESDKFFTEGKFKGIELDSKTPRDIDLSSYNLVTINYEMLDRFKGAIERAGLDTLVFDESHRIKNPGAKITKLATEMAATFPHRILMSGTPIKNKKDEIFSQANIIKPGTFESKQHVKRMQVFDVKEKMKEFFFRRTKKQELTTLPEKIRQSVHVENEDEHGELPDWKRGMQVGELSSLKTELAVAKVPQTADFVNDILDNSESKVILFTDSIQAANKLKEVFGDRAVLHTGDTSHEKREEFKAVFTNPDSPQRVFIATTGSAREGLNLTVADKVVFNDLPWTPANVNQAEDRAHRIGQKKALNVYWMTTRGNRFDENVQALLKRKMDIFSRIVDGRKPTPEEQAEYDRRISPEEIMAEMERSAAATPGGKDTTGS